MCLVETGKKRSVGDPTNSCRSDREFIRQWVKEVFKETVPDVRGLPTRSMENFTPWRTPLDRIRGTRGKFLCVSPCNCHVSSIVVTKDCRYYVPSLGSSILSLKSRSGEGLVCVRKDSFSGKHSIISGRFKMRV